MQKQALKWVHKGLGSCMAQNCELPSGKMQTGQKWSRDAEQGHHMVERGSATLAGSTLVPVHRYKGAPCQLCSPSVSALLAGGAALTFARVVVLPALPAYPILQVALEAPDQVHVARQELQLVDVPCSPAPASPLAERPQAVSYKSWKYTTVAGGGPG